MRRFGSTFATAAIAALWLISASLSGQAKPKPDPETPPSFGTVTGHVYIAGSNAPARLVSIALQPLQVQLADKSQPGKMPKMAFTIYETDLDGGYTIPRVQPGSYYVVITEPGFLSPFAQFTPEELANPSPEVAQRIAATLPAVTVRPNSTATLDIRLQRGATVSGMARFDDGIPYPGAYVSVERHEADGKWVAPHGAGSGHADGDGRWQISGLVPGEYRVRLNLSLEDRQQSTLLGNSIAQRSRTKYSLTIYSGDTARERDAKPVTLEENQQLGGEDITIPVSKLHAVTGAVVDATTGKALNAGRVQLVYADDGKSLNTATIDPETRTFTFDFVPEGEYKLKTDDAREVRPEPAADASSDEEFFRVQRKGTATLRQYAPGEMPLVVQGDLNAVNLAVQAKAATP